MGRKWKAHGLNIVVVSESRYLYYSGAVPQYMGGFYKIDEARIDIKKLCHKYDAIFIEDSVKTINHPERYVSGLKDSYKFDYLVINTGVISKAADNLDDCVYPVKPMSRLIKLRDRIDEWEVKSLLIAGGGPAGCEIALNLSNASSPKKIKIEIHEYSDKLMSSFPDKLSSGVESVLRARNVELKFNQPWTDESNLDKDYDAIILATGNRPAILSEAHSFTTDSEGRIRTDQFLMVESSSSIFAAGDVAHAGAKSYPQIGVHAVKQGVTLRHNVLAHHLGNPLKAYKPWKIAPLIISDGCENGYFVTSNKVYSGRWAIILKYMLDMKWLERYTKAPHERRSYVELLKDAMKRTQKS